MVITTPSLPTLPRVRLLSPEVVFAGLNPDRKTVVDEFVQGARSEEDRSLKRQSMAELLTYKPYMSADALKAIALCVNKSSHIDGRRAKLEGFTAIYRHTPHLRDEVLTEIIALVNGSNCPEGYAEKLAALDDMLKLQPDLKPKFVTQLRLLVDHSTGVPARAMKLDSVKSMLEKNRDLTPEFLGTVRGFVNESNSNEGRRLKLGTLNGILQRCPTLDEARVKAMGAAIHKSPDLPERRVALKSLEQAFRFQPNVPAETLTSMTGFIYGETDRNGLEERGSTAVRLLRLDPASNSDAMKYVAAEAKSSLTAVDGTLRARVAVNDLLVANRLGMSLDRMFELSSVASTAGAQIAAGLLHPDSPLSMAQDSLQVCRERAQHFGDAAALPREKLLRVYQKRELEVRQKYLYKIAVIAGAAALVGGCGAMVAQCFVPLSTGAIWGITAASAGLSLGYGKVQVDRAAERHVRRELEGERDYWRGQLERHERIEPAIESLLAGQKSTAPGVHETEEVVVVGAIRVRRKSGEE